MRTTDRTDDGPAHEVRVVGAQDEAASVLIRLVILVEVADERRSEKGWNVGIVHDVLAGVAIDLEGVDIAVLGVVHLAVLLNRIAQVGSHGAHLLGKIVLTNGCGNVRAVRQIAAKHHVAGDQELEDRRIVRWPEERADEACAVLHRIAQPIVGLRLRRSVRLSGELIRDVVHHRRSVHKLAPSGSARCPGSY